MSWALAIGSGHTVFFGGNKDSLEYFIYFVIKGLFSGDRTYVDKAYRAILDQDEKKIPKLSKEIL